MSDPTTVQDLLNAFDAFAPHRFAESWDNVGLLVGSATWSAARTMLTIDLTAPVLDEAIAAGVNTISAYHPPIFEAMKRITDQDAKQQLVLRAIEHRIAIHAPHTALDTARGGVNDWLAAGCGPGTVTALVPLDARPDSEAFKVITFLPGHALDAVRTAMSGAGAGRIGAYDSCSTSMPVVGTFRGGPDTNPTVGQAGQFETADETRLEMVAAERDLPRVIMALRGTHPYEEPPIDVIALGPRPDLMRGGGRRVVLDEPITVAALADRLSRHLGVSHLRLAGEGLVTTVGLCAGAGGGFLSTALAQGCDAFFTGEMRYHDVLAAVAANCAVVLAGHSNTERGYLPHLRDRLTESVPDATFMVSEADAYPLRVHG